MNSTLSVSSLDRLFHGLWYSGLSNLEGQDQQEESNCWLCPNCPRTALCLSGCASFGIPTLISQFIAQRVNDIEAWKTVGLGVPSFEKWNRKSKQQTEFANRIAMSVCMRSVEDWCFQRMRRVIGLKESEILVHETLVDLFPLKHISLSCERSHLLSLKSSAEDER